MRRLRRLWRRLAGISGFVIRMPTVSLEYRRNPIEDAFVADKGCVLSSSAGPERLRHRNEIRVNTRSLIIGRRLITEMADLTTLE